MSNLRDRKRLSYSLKDRRYRTDSSTGYFSVKRIMVLSLFALICGITGLYLGSVFIYFPAQQNMTIQTSEWSFHFTSPENDANMEGLLGYTYRGNGNHVWLHSKLLKAEKERLLKETCEHEVLHALGIPGKHHDYIYSYQGQVDTVACLKLEEKVADRYGQ